MDSQTAVLASFAVLLGVVLVATSASALACDDDRFYASPEQVDRMADEPLEDGVYVSGRITLETNGSPGLAGVTALQAVDAYPEDDAPFAITDRTGTYHFDFIEMESGQTVYVRPVLQGYVFLPEWRWYDYEGTGARSVELDFVAHMIGGVPFVRLALPIAYRNQ